MGREGRKECALESPGRREMEGKKRCLEEIKGEGWKGNIGCMVKFIAKGGKEEYAVESHGRRGKERKKRCMKDLE